MKEKIIVKINGMHCGACAKRVETALSAIKGAKAKVELAKNEAVMIISSPVEDKTITDAVAALGFSVVDIIR